MRTCGIYLCLLIHLQWLIWIFGFVQMFPHRFGDLDRTLFITRFQRSKNPKLLGNGEVKRAVLILFATSVESNSDVEMRLSSSLPDTGLKTKPSSFSDKNVTKKEEQYAKITRLKLARVLDSFWKQIEELLSEKNILRPCEVGLREATSLLILATVRRAADKHDSSKQVVQWMFRAADVNQDGQLTYQEWYDWLVDSRSAVQSHLFGIDFKGESDSDPMIFDLQQVLSHAFTSLFYISRISDDPNTLIATFISGGMISVRELIVHGITLEATKITAAMNLLVPASQTNDPEEAIPSPGGFQKDLPKSVILKPFTTNSRAYLAKTQKNNHHFLKHDYKPSIRASNITVTRLRPQNVSVPFAQVKLPPRPPDLKSSIVGQEVIANREIVIRPKKTRAWAKPSRAASKRKNSPYDQTRQIVEDVLLTIPTLTKTNPNLASRENGAEDTEYDGQDGFLDSLPSWEEDDSELMRETLNNKDVVATTEAGSHLYSKETVLRMSKSNALVKLADFSNSRKQHVSRRASGIGNDPLLRDGSLDSPEEVKASASLEIELNEDNEAIIRRYERFLEEMNMLQQTISDFDDEECRQLRQLLNDRVDEIAKSSEAKGNIIAQVLALRLSRLQNLPRDDPNRESPTALAQPSITYSSHLQTDRFVSRRKAMKAHYRQLAMETIQIFSPLSHQYEFAKFLPELELHSYNRLFPRSFQSFLSWYQIFTPLARHMISNFQHHFLTKLRSDALLAKYCRKLTIDSRVKSEHSSYTKMLHQAKRREELHDLIGIRIIFTPSPQAIAQQPRNTRKSLNRKTKAGVNASSSVREDRVVTVEEMVDRVEGSTTIKSEEKIVRDLVEGRQEIVVIQENNRSETDPSLSKELLVWSSPITVKPTQTPESFDYDYCDQSAHMVEWVIATHLRELLQGLEEWSEDTRRFKDYIAHPKPSGYQSLHLVFNHTLTGFCVEVQVRSSRMHCNAESGTASHRHYKAKLLPSSTSAHI